MTEYLNYMYLTITLELKHALLPKYNEMFLNLQGSTTVLLHGKMLYMLKTCLEVSVPSCRKQGKMRKEIYLLYRHYGGNLLSQAGKLAPGSRHT